MKIDITGIPVSEVFEPREGCPICRMRDMLEQRMIEYITGAAMMEPDIRIETNRQGFCGVHYGMMLKKRNRLSLALMLESHLAELEKQVFSGPPLIGKNPRRQGGSAGKTADSCFVCGQVETAMSRMLDTVCRMWERERDFRELFRSQEALCLPHFALLAEVSEGSVSKRNAQDFRRDASELCRKYLLPLKEDVSHFCRMFDYRNTGEDADWGNSRDAIERAIWWLAGRKP